VRSIHRKALRDLWHLRSQAVAIALVIAAGIANLVMSRSTYESLQDTRARFYREYAFADAWASARRAPEALAARIADLPGVSRVETRLVAAARLEVAGFDEPVRAQLVSLPEDGQPLLNRLHLRQGRMPEPGMRDEAVVSEAFAQAQSLGPGSRLRAIVYGRATTLRVVGVAISPEHVYQIQPGAAFPDFKRYAVVWMARRSLEAALDMDGAFNNVAVQFAPGANERAVLDGLDELLRRYGGLGAFGRRDQLSNRFLHEELRQLDTMAALFPTIFLSVAAFLLNVVLRRLIDTQRDQIAILKAFGYAGRAIAVHYATIVGAIGLVGTAFGIGGGVLLGHWLAGVYQTFYRFPFLDFRLDAGTVLLGVAVSLAAALAGTLQSVLHAMRLPPAEAMRPPAPDRYRQTLLERVLPQRWLSQPVRMIVRHIERRPVKAALSVVGLALACAIMMVGRFQQDSIDWMVDVQFRLAQRNDLQVDFTEATARAAAWELRALPGVLDFEPYRNVSVRLSHGTRTHRTGLQGLVPDARLKRPLDARLRPFALPTAGLVLTDHLARMLDVRVGDTVTVEVLEGRRAVLEVPVVGTVTEYIGVQGYMDLEALNRLLRDGDVVSGVYLRVDPARQQALYAAIERRPRVAGIGVRKLAVASFYDTLAESMLVFAFVSLVLGAVINFGVVYNAARIALSERGRELASLRVLGLTRGEVSWILLGELGLLVAVSIPLGFAAGWAICAYMAGQLQSELYRVPVHVSAATYTFAGLAMVASTIVSAVVVRRRIDRLDLVGVLKTRE
jgi:putative ABC transport system permease protein